MKPREVNGIRGFFAWNSSMTKNKLADTHASPIHRWNVLLSVDPCELGVIAIRKAVIAIVNVMVPI